MCVIVRCPNDTEIFAGAGLIIASSSVCLAVNDLLLSGLLIAHRGPLACLELKPIIRSLLACERKGQICLLVVYSFYNPH